MLSPAPVTPLREMLRAGLSVFQEVWNHKAKDWITSICAADINNDSYLEIVACSRDGRVLTFAKDHKLLWERVVGSKAWAGTVACVKADKDHSACILVGTRDGKVYAFAQDGRTIGKDGGLYDFGKDGWAIDREKERNSCWLDTRAPVRQVFVVSASSSYMVVGSENGYTYAIDIATRKLRWTFQADGWVRAVCCSDIDGDGRVETLIGSHEKTLFVLSDDGRKRQCLNMDYPIHAVFAADIDHDGQVEILVATDGKNLVALSPTLQKRWSRQFSNRIPALYVADINNDGQQEIIAGSEDNHVYILNQLGETLWRHYIKYRVLSVYAADVDNDDRLEILVGAANDRIYAFRFELTDDLQKRIQDAWQAFKKTLRDSPQDLGQLLPSDELRLLSDILKEEEHQREELKHVTLQETDRLLESGQHYAALVNLLKLERYHAQVQLRKGKRDGLKNIRSFCISHLNATKRSIVVGTNDGDVHIFSGKGRHLKKINVGERILDIQPGYIDQGKSEQIIVCTSDHKIYVLSGTSQEEKYEWKVGYETACIYVNNGTWRRPSEIFTGSQATINIYEDGLLAPLSSINLQESVSIIHAYTRTEQEMPEIIAGSANRFVYAYKRDGVYLWEYEACDRVQSLDMRDIDRDGEVEVIVGSEDRNIYVLDSRGKLRWRFFLPHSVLAVQAIDVDQDDQIEILAGCADGWLYVFNKDGDLLWKYRASDRIRALQALDIDDDGNIEIIFATDDELEIISVVDQQQVHERIKRCLEALQGDRSLKDVCLEMLYPSHPGIPVRPDLRAFAIVRLMKQPDLAPEVFDIFEQFMKDNDVDVRKAVIQAIVACYTLDEPRAAQLLNQLAKDASLEVQLAFLEQMPLLMKLDWRTGFEHLKRFFDEGRRMVRRAAERQLNRLIEVPWSGKSGRRDIFVLLIEATNSEDSEWIRQEAARVLAHFLDSHREGLIIYMHLFLVNGVRPAIVDLVRHYSASPLVRKFIEVVMPFFRNPRDLQAADYLPGILQVLQDMTMLEYGRDALRMYKELSHLFSLKTIEDIGAYSCSLTSEDFRLDNELAKTFMRVLKQVSIISRYFSIYLRRASVFDRLTSLLDAEKVISEAIKFVEWTYSDSLMDRPMEPLPDYWLFSLLLQRWHEMVQAVKRELRGDVHLEVELQTKAVHYEERVAILLGVHNAGRMVADNVKISLLHSSDFDVLGNPSVEVETLFSGETRQAEFTLKLSDAYLQRTTADCAANFIHLRVEVVYDDAEHRLQILQFEDHLEFNAAVLQDFRNIPNHYSTGTPVQEDQMFYGRDQDVAVLRRNLADAVAQTIILLHGQRRTGKTTLLRHLTRSSVLRDHIPVFIDMQREVYDFSVSRLLYHLAYDIAQAMIDKGYTVLLPKLQDYEADPTFVFDNFLKQVKSYLHLHKLIILIDEFEELEEQIKKKRLDPEFLNYLRSVMQHHAANFLLAGMHKLDQLTQANWSVFFNIAYQYRLSKLSPQGAEDLIRKPVATYLEYGPFTVEKIRQLTADQPYLINLLCWALVSRCNEQRKVYVTINDVNAAKCEAMQMCTAHFRWLWENLIAEEQLLLVLISELSKEEGRWVSYGEIEARYRYYRFSYERKALRAWIKALELADVIEIVVGSTMDTSFLDGCLRIPAGLMRMWLLREKPLRLLVGEQQAPIS